MAVRAVLTIAAGCCLFLGGLAAAALCLDAQFAAVNAKALLSCSLWALGLLWLRRQIDRWVGAGETRGLVWLDTVVSEVDHSADLAAARPMFDNESQGVDWLFDADHMRHTLYLDRCGLVTTTPTGNPIEV